MAVRDLYIGEIPGQPVGTYFSSRRDAMEAHVHTQSGRGIDARVDEPGAGAVCPSGGYADDIDHGDWVLYTGQGGRDAASGEQIADQSLEAKDNAALVDSYQRGWPVRVLRGNDASIYSPSNGYRYDGLYWVDDYWTEPGKHQFLVCRFLLVQMTPEEALPWVDMSDYPGRSLPSIMSWTRTSPDRREPPPGRGQRILNRQPTNATPSPAPPDLPDVDQLEADDAADFGDIPVGNETPGTAVSLTYKKQRDVRVAKAVKALYGNRCQVCDLRIDLASGPYSEGAHVRPIGEPHNGSDTPSNVLCLCPNHHAMFDGGGIYVAANHFVYERDGSPVGPLSVMLAKHPLSPANFAYHRKLHGFD